MVCGYLWTKEGNEVEKIVAKKWILDHFDQYGIDLKDKSEMVALLNVLQAAGENLDSFHSCVLNGHREFMDNIHMGCGWESDQELYETVMEHSNFIPEEKFISWMIERIDDLKDDGFDDPAEEIRCWTYDEEPSDTKIYKTEDGYVVRVWC